MITKLLQLVLSEEKMTCRLGELFSHLVVPPFTIYLLGELGAGKTTFCRGFIQGQGYQGIVKSPTYTLVEPYDFPSLDRQILHFDLYRLNDAEELEFIGIRDYLDAKPICLIEWPYRGEPYIPRADIILHLHYHGTQRQAKITSTTTKGLSVLQKLEDRWKAQ